MINSSTKNKKSVILNSRNLRVRNSLDDGDLRTLRRKGIPKDALPATVKAASFDSMGNHYHGIAFQNLKKGWMIYEDTILFTSITIGNPGMVYIKNSAGYKTKTCCVFTDLMDYFSFLTLQYYEPREKFMFADCFILGDATVFLTCAEYSRKYSNIFCLFPYNSTGRMMYLTLKDMNSDSNVQDDDLYKDCESLQKFLEIHKKQNEMRFQML